MVGLFTSDEVRLLIEFARLFSPKVGNMLDVGKEDPPPVPG